MAAVVTKLGCSTICSGKAVKVTGAEPQLAGCKAGLFWRPYTIQAPSRLPKNAMSTVAPYWRNFDIGRVFDLTELPNECSKIVPKTGNR